MKKTSLKIIALTGMLSLLGAAHAAADEKPSADFSVSAYSKYVWRGMELSKDSIVLQSSMTVAYKGFSANLWGNADTDQYWDDTFNWNETDFTLAYERALGKATLSGGYIYYDLDGLTDSQELFVGLSYDCLLSPSVTIYKEIAHMPSWYVSASIGHSFPLTESYSLDVGASLGYLASDDADAYADNDGDEFSDLLDGLLSASISFPMGEYFTLTPEVYYSFAASGDGSDLLESVSMDGDEDNFLYGGVSLSFAF